MTRPNYVLTPPELEIMRIVWPMKGATVRDVYETLRERRKVAYTTVLTVMRVLEAKGYLERSRDDRAHVYRATLAESDIERSMVREFLDRVFHGSSRALLVHLLKDRRLRPEELESLAEEVKGARRPRKKKEKA
jgi:BlaI family transcriptional regulator, penicillinase repressor